MAYVTVPKDLTKIKSKVMFNLTKRQLICFSAAVAIGLPLFFLVKGSVGTSAAALCTIDFLNHYRLEVSCHLLNTTKMSIAEICTACGFNHQSYYSKIFLRTYHCTPRDFRKRAEVLPT